MVSYSSGREFDVTSVSFGVESVNVTQTVRVRLYTTANFPAGFPTSLHQIGSTIVTVTSGQGGTMVTAPLDAAIPAGTSQLVMELFTPDGRSDGKMFFVGSNAAPETGPSYISASACGSNVPKTTASLGAPDMHIVFNVSGSCVEPTPVPRLATLRNISTRLRVGTGDRAMTAGFIIQGEASKRVLIRAIGPSLTGFGVLGALANPQVELHDSNSLIARNDDWQATQIGGVVTSNQMVDIENTGLAPTNSFEAGLIATLSPGGYTAIMSGVAGETGVGVIEVYDLDGTNASLLGNISTRGYVQTGNDVMIGGFIVLDAPTRVMVRATGPSLSQFGVPDTLGNPQLELHDANTLLARNDDWQTTQIEGVILGDQVSEIQASQLAPLDSAESAIITTLPPGSYTAIVRGANGSIGNAVVEAFALP